MGPEPEDVARFGANLNALAPRAARLGIALSGGPDSLALLLLAAAARPGEVEAATVDHGLRDGSRDEAIQAGQTCEQLSVPHAILTVDWPEKPTTAIQERARAERYRLLAAWASERALDTILTGHHADDQAETMLMRLNRGAGVRGLAGMRLISTVPGSNVPLLRPFLGWRRSDLERICSAAGVEPLTDPSNSDDRFERARIRKSIAAADDWLDASAIVVSAAHLASADEALDWALDQEWQRAVTSKSDHILYEPTGAPAEILRRLVARAVAMLAQEGTAEPIRGRELDPLIVTLHQGGKGTLRGVVCSGGPSWRFSKAPPRRT